MRWFCKKMIQSFILPRCPFNSQFECQEFFTLKIKSLHIHLYFIATQYLWHYALVQDIDNWTRSYTEIVINNIERVSLAGNLKVGKPRFCCFIFKTQHRFLLKLKFINWEQKRHKIFRHSSLISKDITFCI